MELIDVGAAAVVLPLAAAVDSFLAEVAAGAVTRLSDADVLAEVRGLEVLRRRLSVADHALVAELDRRGLAATLAMKTTSGLLQGMLRLSPHEAKRRVDAGRVCGPRASLTGESLEPLLPELAAAQHEGALSGEHAHVITRTLEAFPPDLSTGQFALAEHTLVELARHARPAEVAKAGERYLAYLHPDGTLASDEQHDRVRELLLQPRPDGSYDLKGRLTPACGAQLLATLTPRSAPRPADADGPDPRGHRQRLHDALEELASIWSRATSSPTPVPPRRSSSP